MPPGRAGRRNLFSALRLRLATRLAAIARLHSISLLPRYKILQSVTQCCRTGPCCAFYYRIQGPHLVIEYAPQTLGGDPAMHVHTMYRDPTNDYGRGLTKQ